MQPLTSAEQTRIDDIRTKLARLREVVNAVGLDEHVDSLALYASLARLKTVQGNLSNELSFVAGLMAKDYLHSKFSLTPYDAAEKAQGAPGLDVDVRTIDGKRIIGEIKTTDPYKINDFGAKQKEEFERDFNKLNNEQAYHKFFFVTEARAFDMVKRRYASRLRGATVVLLTTGQEYLEEDFAR
jgi:hypothetical protein